MRLRIVTLVKASLQQVKKGFDQELFLTLNPPFPPVKLLQFDGCKAGDLVALELNFLLFKQQWVSKITDDYEDDRSWVFVDEGEKLPFFLKRWRHEHQVISAKKGSEIVDQIHFSSGYALIDIFLYPVLYLQFLYRKPIYKKIFRVH